MRSNTLTAALVASAANAMAQNATSTTYAYYNSCSSTSGSAEEIPTTIATNTLTYCPPCEAAGMTMFPSGSLTTYQTMYPAPCETCESGGFEDKTYTVTEPCPSSGLDRSADHVPQGFVTTTMPCGCPENTHTPVTKPGSALAGAMAQNTPAAANVAPTAAPASGAVPESPESAPASGPKEETPTSAPESGSPPGEAPEAASPPESESSPGSASEAASAPATSGETPEENSSPANAPAAAPVAKYPTSPAGSPGSVGSASPSGGSTSNKTMPFLGSAMPSTSGMSYVTGLMALLAAICFVL